MITTYNKVNLILHVRIIGNDNLPIVGVTGDDGQWEMAYKNVNAAWVPITLSNGILNTYVSGGLVEDPDGDGLYQLGLPNEAKIAGERTLLRFKYGGNDYHYDAIDFVQAPVSVNSGSDAVELNFSIPGTDVIFSTEGANLYIKETGRQIVFTANQNIEAETLVIIFEESDNVDKYIIQDGDIIKSGDTATITLPVGYTDELNNLNWAVRRASDKRVYGHGSRSVTYIPHEDI